MMGMLEDVQLGLQFQQGGSEMCGTDRVGSTGLNTILGLHAARAVLLCFSFNGVFDELQSCARQAIPVVISIRAYPASSLTVHSAAACNFQFLMVV